MKRGAALAGYAIAEVSTLMAMGIVLATGVVVTGRGIEWLLLWRQVRREG